MSLAALLLAIGVCVVADHEFQQFVDKLGIKFNVLERVDELVKEVSTEVVMLLVMIKDLLHFGYALRFRDKSALRNFAEQQQQHQKSTSSSGVPTSVGSSSTFDSTTNDIWQPSYPISSNATLRRALFLALSTKLR